MQDDTDELIMLSENGRCYLSLRNIDANMQGMETMGVNYEMGGTILCKTVKENVLG